jgi:hypothetical protein
MIRVELLCDRRKKIVGINFLEDKNAMDTAGTATRRDPDKPRDHLDVFREFIDHLERNARSATAAAQNKRRRANSR